MTHPTAAWRRAVRYRTVAPDGREVDFYDAEDGSRESGRLYLSEFEHGYAGTVHKAQGDQFDTVVAIMEPDERFYTADRALLYTAVSRAKRKCILCTSNAALEKFKLPVYADDYRTALSWSFQRHRQS